MFLLVALASPALTLSDTCIDHTSHRLDLAAACVANVEILGDESTAVAKAAASPMARL